MDLINREQALGCFWNYVNDDGTGYDETEMPAYERLQELPIVAEVEDCISRQAALDALGDEPEVWTGKDEYAQGLNNQWHYDKNAILQCPSAQPKRTDCEYCHEDADGYVKPIEKNCHAFVRFGMNGWELDLKANGWHGETKINYCPMCGRKLQRT